MESDETSDPIVSERVGREPSQESPAATITHTREVAASPSAEPAPRDQDSLDQNGTARAAEYEAFLSRALSAIDAAADHDRLDEHARLVDRLAGKLLGADAARLRAAVDARRAVLDGGLSSLGASILGQIRTARSVECLDALLARISATRTNTTAEERSKLREEARQRRGELGEAARR